MVKRPLIGLFWGPYTEKRIRTINEDALGWEDRKKT